MNLSFDRMVAVVITYWVMEKGLNILLILLEWVEMVYDTQIHEWLKICSKTFYFYYIKEWNILLNLE